MEIIPVIKARMGTHNYYIGKMTFQELVSKVKFYNELKESKELESMLQRELGKRSEEMTSYLLNQKDRFYGAIIIASWGGNPSYNEVEMKDHVILSNNTFHYGVLTFDGKQRYFALDGQHRLKSIKEAVAEKSELGTEEVSVIILTHENTDEGNIKTRRLFHTLNRYAKPTTTGENIALDEDNIISISTRMLLKNIRLLNPNNIELKKSNITPKQTDKFTTLAAIYNFNEYIFNACYRTDRDYLRFRPSPAEVESVYGMLQEVWNKIIKSDDTLNKVDQGIQLLGSYRHQSKEQDKGHVLLRPLGLEILGDIISKLIGNLNKSPSDIVDIKVIYKAIEKANLLPMTLGELPWKGVIFRGNKIDRAGRKLSVKLSQYMLGEGILEEDLLKDYRNHLEDQGAVLPGKL